jgi:hypothetical protein
MMDCRAQRQVAAMSGLDQTLTTQPGVVRDGHLLRIGAPEVDAIEATDRLLYIRHAGQ